METFYFFIYRQFIGYMFFIRASKLIFKFNYCCNKIFFFCISKRSKGDNKVREIIRQILIYTKRNTEKQLTSMK